MHTAPILNYDSLSSQFTGKERDTETGNDYFGARYYESAMGRFLTPDWAATPVPIPYASMALPQTLNLYVYVANNPVTGIDPDGHQDNAPNPSGDSQPQAASTSDERSGGICGMGQACDSEQPTGPAQNQIAQLEEPEREEERPEEQAERALEPVEAPAAGPAAKTAPNPWDEVLSRHSPEDIQAVRNGADSVDPQLAGAIRQKDAFDSILTGGMKVTSNPLGPNQEINITITSPYEPGVKLNLRVETHPIPGSG